jgi:serine/threonine protein kinase
MAEADFQNPRQASPLPTSSDTGETAPVEITVAAAAHLLAVGRTRSRGAREIWAPPSVEDLQRMLPQYEISVLIGRGGMGAVYRGRQRSLDRDVAIKILPPEMAAEDSQFSERFQREGKAMARLSHPGIVAVFDAGETAEGLLYFVMEYVEGTDAQEMLVARGPLPAAEVLPLVMHVCDALEFAHASGFIHRDIKPSNIMVDDRGRVKVADFGLTRAMAVEGVGLTGDSMTICTAEFAAPEAFAPGETLDGRADLYSVGVMLYHLLTGQIPRGRFEGPSSRVEGLDPRIDAIVDRAMQADRERRYSTARELRADLDRILTEPLPPARPRRRSAAGLGKGWLLIGAGVLISVIIFAVWISGTPLGGTTGNPGPPGGSRLEAAPDGSSLPEESVSTVATPAWKPAPYKMNSKMEGGFVHLVKFDTWRSRDFHTNGAVRATIVWQPDRPGSNDYIKVTVRLRENEHYYARFSGSAVEIGLYQSPDVTPLQRWVVTPPAEPGEAIPLQLACVGQRLAVWVRGRLVGTMDETTLTGKGEVSVQAGDAYIQNLEYLKLDDVSEARALALLGLDATGGSR